MTGKSLYIKIIGNKTLRSQLIRRQISETIFQEIDLGSKHGIRFHFIEKCITNQMGFLQSSFIFKNYYMIIPSIGMDDEITAPFVVGVRVVV